jgi:hypothetical protein
MDHPRDGLGLFRSNFPRQKKAALVTFTKRAQAEVKHLRTNFTNCTPSASVNNGRELLGFILDHDHRQCAALTPSRELIGMFADRATASFAIRVHYDIVGP